MEAIEVEAGESTVEDVAVVDAEAIEENIVPVTAGGDWPFPQKWPLNCPERERQVLEYMNQRFFAVKVGGRFRVCGEELDPHENRDDFFMFKRQDFEDMFVHRRVVFEGKSISVATYWLRHAERRQYKGIKFLPLAELDGYYNLWRRYGCEPRAGDCSLYLEHVQSVIASNDQRITNYILDWMAHAVQKPDKLVGTAIVLRGKQGTGKGLFCSIFGKLFGAHFTHISQPSHLTGRFNSHLKRCIVLFCDEAHWGADKKGEGVLKALVTEPTLQIEGKGQDVVEIKNHIHLLVATNNELAIPAGPEERRFLVLDVSDAHKQDHLYFQRLQEQMNNGGQEALLHYLMNRQYDEDSLRKLPQTKALFETKLLSVSLVHKFWYEKLMAGALKAQSDSWNDGKILSSELQEEYQRFAKDAGMSARATSTELGMVLRKLLPGEIRKIRQTVGGVRRIYYQFPPLDACREFFREVMQYKIHWPEKGVAMKP